MWIPQDDPKRVATFRSKLCTIILFVLLVLSCINIRISYIHLKNMREQLHCATVAEPPRSWIRYHSCTILPRQRNRPWRCVELRLLALERWDRNLESDSVHGCVRFFCVRFATCRWRLAYLSSSRVRCVQIHFEAENGVLTQISLQRHRGRQWWDSLRPVRLLLMECCVGSPCTKQSKNIKRQRQA